MLFAELPIEHLVAWLSVVVTIGGGLWWVRVKLNVLICEVRRDRKKLAIVWGFIMSRARSRAKQPLGKHYSSEAGLIATPEIREAFEPVAERLRQLWHENQGISDDDFAMVIEEEAELKEWIIGNICDHFGFNDGECLVWAIAIAKERGKQIRREPNWLKDSD